MPRMLPKQGVRKFTVREYHKLIDDGFFATDEKFELIEGWIVAKMPRNPPHDLAIDKSTDAIRERLPARWRVRAQLAITLSDSEPEPDLAIVLNPADRYGDHHPGPSEIGMLVESSFSTLSFDRADKARVYAMAGIPIYWILNVVDHQVEVYTEPSGVDVNPGYRVQEIFSGDDVVPLLIAGNKIADIPVRELIP